MSCCNKCFEVALHLARPDQARGHVLCSSPTDGEKAAWAFGKSPMLNDNRWLMRAATKSHLDNEDQVWMIDGEYFTVDAKTATAIPAQPIL